MTTRLRKIWPCLSLLGLLMLLYNSAFAGNLHYHIAIDNALSISQTGTYDLVTLEGLEFTRQYGEPCLPVKRLLFALPPGEKLLAVKVSAGAVNSLPRSVNIYPFQSAKAFPGKVTVDRLNGLPVTKISSTYRLSALYPKDWYEVASSGRSGGVVLVELNIYPLRFHPQSRKAELCRDFEITLETAHSGEAVRNNPVWQSKLTQMVTNPEVLNRATTPTVVTDNILNDIEYLIITSRDMLPQFQTLADWRIQKGIPTSIDIIEDILATSPGRDDAEKLRNHIKEVWNYNDLSYVLLGGDSPVVPHREIFCDAFDVEGGQYLSSTFATDLYFTDLDSTWDTDNDGEFADINDQIDMYPDVALGRLPVDADWEADDVISKLMTYEKMPQLSYQTKTLFVADYTGYYDIFSSVAKDPIAAADFPPRFHPITKLYDDYQNYPDAQRNTADDQRQLLNQGYHIVNHFGHGGRNTFCYLNKSDVQNFQNGPKYSIFATCACYNGDFTITDDCAGEAFLLNPDGGGVAFLGNTDFGIGFPSGMLIDEKFFHMLFKQHMYPIGEAHVFSKTLMMANAHTWSHPDRWTHFVFHLLGEPAMPIWTDKPHPMTVSHSRYFYAGQNRFDIQVHDGSYPIKDAVVALYQEGESLMRARTDGQGWARFRFTANQNKMLKITVTAQNCLPYTSIATFSSAQPTATPVNSPTPMDTPTPTPVPTEPPTETPAPTLTPTPSGPTPTPQPGTLPRWAIGDWWKYHESYEIVLSFADQGVEIEIPAELYTDIQYSVKEIVPATSSDSGEEEYLLDYKGTLEVYAHDFDAIGMHVDHFKLENGSYMGEMRYLTADLRLLYQSRFIYGEIHADVGFGYFPFGPLYLNMTEEFEPGDPIYDFPLQAGDAWQEDFTMRITGGYESMGIESTFNYTSQRKFDYNILGIEFAHGKTSYHLREKQRIGVGGLATRHTWYHPGTANYVRMTLEDWKLAPEWNTKRAEFVLTDSSREGTLPKVGPAIWLGGYADTMLSNQGGGTLTMWAMTDPQSLYPSDSVSVLFQGLDTGVRLQESLPHQFYILPPVQLAPGVPACEMLLELCAEDAQGGRSELWPYLKVE